MRPSPAFPMSPKPPGLLKFGVGSMGKLSLRVSVATLVRVLFEHPRNGELMLALERRATLRETEAGRVVDVKAQPFGGAIRIHDLGPLQSLIGDFHFDSEESRAEQDFRLLIRPSDWETVRRFCIQHFDDDSDPVLEATPERELVEEFSAVLKVNLSTDGFSYRLVGTILEDHPSPTENAHARSQPTVRMYRVFESRILDDSLANMLLRNGETYTDDGLRELALQDAQEGRKGWANAALTLPMRQISAFYAAILPDARNSPVSFQGYQLDETVAAVLENVSIPKFHKV